MLTRSRQDAISRAVEMAESAGADAILGLRFDCSEITQSLSEVAAYGTAVTLVTIDGGDLADDDAETSRVQPEAQAAPADTGQQWPPSSWPSSS
jgi:hypothetical protein